MFVLQVDNKGIPYNGEVYCAYDGCIQNGWYYEFSTIERLVDYYPSKAIPVGSIDFVREVFKENNIECPKLPSNSNRPSIKMTLKEALELRASSNTNLFIKPTFAKEFTGFVHEGYSYTCLNHIPPHSEVLVYDVFPSPILTEWRAYIYKHEIIDIRNYSGDFFLLPDKEYIERVVELNRTSFPVAYSIDVAVLENAENMVVEYNDFWALGNYGIPNWLYVKCLKARWLEINT